MKGKQNCNVVVQWSVQGFHILAVFLAILYTLFVFMCNGCRYKCSVA